MPPIINLPSPSSSPSLARFATTLALADAIGLRAQFWSDVLTSTPKPASANDAADLAVRLFIETRLAQFGPDTAVDMIAQVLDPSATWESLGLASMTTATIGQELTAQLKTDLGAALDAFAVVWLSQLSETIDGVALA